MLKHVSVKDHMKNVKISGWVKSVRMHRNVSFVEVNDGSCFRNMQIVVKSPLNVNGLSIGSSVSVSGCVLKKKCGELVEMKASEIKLIGDCSTLEYPLQKKVQGLEFLRTQLHLRYRTNTFGAVARIRNALSHGLHCYFQKEDFMQMHTPILTGNDAEGAGEQFKVVTNDKCEFFDKPTFLTVSGQLHAEIQACALSRVYTFGPTFRAENSNTSRHLAEFWMLEPEMAFCDLSQAMVIAQEAIQAAIRYALKSCPQDLDFFSEMQNENELLDMLHHIVQHDFPRISYTQAIDILRDAKAEFEVQPEWGHDLRTEHEQYLSDIHYKGPVFVTDYPASIKPFYMRSNDVEEGHRQTVACMDLLVPRIGELIGGSQREERYDVLTRNMKNVQGLEWYADLRKYGTVPHAGWGLGFERLVLLVTGLTNIRDVIPIPRSVGSCPY